MTDGEGERLKGIGVSGGVMVGHIHVVREAKAESRAFTSAAEETRLLHAALAAARGEIEALIAGEDQLAADILEFQLALLEDDDFLAPVGRAIAAGTPADQAWAATLDEEIAEYQSGGSDVLAARAADLADLKQRVLDAFQARELSANRCESTRLS